AAVGAPTTAVALRAPRGDAGPTWLIAPTNAPGPVCLALETDSGLALTAMALGNTALLFGPGLPGSWVTAADSAPPAGSGGIPLIGAWRRFAIAWTMQAWGLARSEPTGRVLLWRRVVVERLQRLAPFAEFCPPASALRNGAICGVCGGSVLNN